MHEIGRNEDVVLCGVAKNQEDYYRYFDKILYLFIDLDTVKRRISSRDTGNFGKYPHERDYIIQNAEQIYKNAHAANAAIIDATKPLEEVIEDICILLPTKNA
jgi:thymidylate kinase